MTFCKLALTVLLFFPAGLAAAQDSLIVSVSEADKMFVRKNLLLVAEKLNIDNQKALETQARLYPNPEFSMGLNAYDNDNKKPLYAGRNGQKTFDFQQLILLGRKRTNQVNLARENTRQAEIQFETLLRDLKYELHANLYSVYFDLKTLNKYTLQLLQLDTIIQACENQAKKGNIALKEVVRLKSAYIRINNDKTLLLQSIQQAQKDLQILLHTDRFVVPIVEISELDNLRTVGSVDSLTTLAISHRDDLKAASSEIAISNLNYKYQKSLAVPDLKIGTAYDQMGGAFSHQFMLTLGVPVPLWNRNQGNIRAAAVQQQVAAVKLGLHQKIIETEVQEAWTNMTRSIMQYDKIKEVYNSDFGDVYAGMQANFLKRNISLLEFIDFFESYSETVAEVYATTKELMISAENLNHTIAYPVYSIK